MEVPDRLKGILDVLTDFHTSTVVDMIESNTEPITLTFLRKRLSQYSTILILFIQTDGNYIHPAADTAVLACIHDLKPYLYPPDATVSTRAIYWIEQLFEEAPFTLSPQHIQRLKESVNTIDGDEQEHSKKPA